MWPFQRHTDVAQSASQRTCTSMPVTRTSMCCVRPRYISSKPSAAALRCRRGHIPGGTLLDDKPGEVQAGTAHVCMSWGLVRLRKTARVAEGKGILSWRLAAANDRTVWRHVGATSSGSGWRHARAHLGSAEMKCQQATENTHRSCNPSQP